MADRRRDGRAEARPGRRPRSGALWVWSAAAAITVAAVGASLFSRPRPLLLWNASASSAVGLYAVISSKVPRVGDMIVAWPPSSARRLAAARHYVPLHVPLVKPVAAVAGDRVCARGDRIFINGRPAARRLRSDPVGRPMPRWSGCARLQRGDLFLLSHTGPLAFDGRYFGITQQSDLVGTARLLWAKPVEGSGND